MSAAFETERLVVRPFRDDEVDFVFDVLRRPDVTRWFGTPRPLGDPSEAVERMAGWRAISDGDPRLGNWCVALRDDDRPVGCVLIKRVAPGAEEAEVGWWLHPDDTGHGYAAEAARGAIAKAFADGAAEVFAITHTTNEPSKRVALAAGMTDLGVVTDRWYPGESQLFRIGRPLARTDAGEGPAVVLIHGHPFDRTTWDPQVEALRADHRVVAPDLRGYGESLATRATTLRELADDVEALADELGIAQAAVVGLSMGGLIAMELATTNPERWTRLGLVATTAEPPDPEDRAARLAMADRIEAEGMEAAVEAMAPKLFGPDAPTELRERIVAIMRATDPRGAVAALRARAARPDQQPGLRALTMPVLVVTGTEDAYSTPPVTRRILDCIPHAQHVSIEGAGHLPNLEAPEQFDAALRAFLDR